MCAKHNQIWYIICMIKKRLLSGVKPTNRPHIGNYFGAIKQFVDLQNDYDSYIFIADLHALTTINDKEKLNNFIFDVMVDYLACGLDPEKVTIFKQSDIKEHAMLAWIFDTLAPMPYLMRAHAYKDALAKDKEINVGLFNYPMLMAADILIYDTDIVPVGQDQKQHVEYARDMAQKFNNIYGQTFKMPETLILDKVAIVPGVDGKKMSKSYGNVIPLFGSDSEIKSAVMGIVTDSKSQAESKNPDDCNIYSLIKLFVEGEELEKIREKYLNGGLSYKEAKEYLYSQIIDFITPMREKRIKLANDRQTIINILQEGGKKAQKYAEKKMAEISDKVGLNIYH